MLPTHTYVLAGDECHIYVPQSREDLAGFYAFLAQGDSVLGFDSETMNLDIYSETYRATRSAFGLPMAPFARLVQLGNRTEAWVLRADLFPDVIRDALLLPRHFTAHNAPFDWLVVDRHLGVPLESLGPRCFDTRIFAHLLDPRPEHEGGAGLGLKRLSEVYVDPSAPDTQEDLTEVFHRDYKATKNTGWAVIDIDHPVYTLYAGLDAILARRLFDELSAIIRNVGQSHLSTFEHHVAVLMAILQRKGIKVDVGYTERLREDLLRDAEAFALKAKRYGVSNVNSTAQVGEALVAMGETLTERTKTGLKVDKAILLPLADLDPFWNRLEVREPNPLADAVMRSKRAAKWSTSYAQAFLDLRDEGDRLHPFIGALAARTARMSISKPPLQQLPSSDWRVRRALVADPGHLIISSDYDQIEMRVLAGLAEEPKMIQAILDGVDLHDFTAEMIYGPEFTKAHRKLAKGVGFGKVYGGGATTLSRQTGAPLAEVQHAIRGYDKAYPGIRKYGRRLQSRAQYGKREVITETGRHLPLDRDRLYSATNYAVQSLSRDILAQAIVDLFDKGLGDHLLLPVHDELVAQAPKADAPEVARTIGETMTRTFKGVPITSTGEVVGPTWGHAYGAPDDV
jgi:DNA polymerase-1